MQVYGFGHGSTQENEKLRTVFLEHLARPGLPCCNLTVVLEIFVTLQF